MPHDRCPICNSEGENLYPVIKDYFILKGNSPDFSINFCPSCKVGYTLPIMSNEELSAYYPADYEAYVAKKSFTSFLQKIKYKSDLKKIVNYSDRKNLSLFEIGTGRGEFLKEAEIFGFQVNGLEPSLAGREYAFKNFGLSIQEGTAEEMKFVRQYDIVVLRHVLEHVGNPYQCLENIYKNGLKENGTLFLKLPRLDSGEARLFKRFWSGLDSPRHRTHYTKQGINNILEKIGFFDISVESEVVPTDIMRSIEYHAYDDCKCIIKLAAILFSKLPYLFKYLICQFIGMILSLFGTGRMIVFARKR